MNYYRIWTSLDFEALGTLPFSGTTCKPTCCCSVTSLLLLLHGDIHSLEFTTAHGCTRAPACLSFRGHGQLALTRIGEAIGRLLFQDTVSQGTRLPLLRCVAAQVADWRALLLGSGAVLGAVDCELMSMRPFWVCVGGAPAYRLLLQCIFELVRWLPCGRQTVQSGGGSLQQNAGKGAAAHISTSWWLECLQTLGAMYLCTESEHHGRGTCSG